LRAPTITSWLRKPGTDGGVCRPRGGWGRSACALTHSTTSVGGSPPGWTRTNPSVWTGEADNGARIEDGADSFLIRDGRIHAMTIHYTLIPPPFPHQRRGA